ncbi:MAG: hypothetical protein AAFW83_10390 [Pseudomonadota bacterium]
MLPTIVTGKKSNNPITLAEERNLNNAVAEDAIGLTVSGMNVISIGDEGLITRAADLADDVSRRGLSVAENVADQAFDLGRDFVDAGASAVRDAGRIGLEGVQSSADLAFMGLSEATGLSARSLREASEIARDAVDRSAEISFAGLREAQALGREGLGVAGDAFRTTTENNRTAFEFGALALQTTADVARDAVEASEQSSSGAFNLGNIRSQVPAETISAQSANTGTVVVIGAVVAVVAVTFMLTRGRS